MSQVVTGLGERIVEFVDSLGFAGDSPGIQISAHFDANIRGPANPLGDQRRSDFTIVASANLVFAQLLDSQGCGANVIDRVPELVELTGVDAFGPKRLFELLEFDTGFL